jgi:glycosyltransferase involved in cell wall biosynthesis
MKILHISSSDISGGAARAAYRLHAGLIREGVDSKMFVREKRSSDENVIRYKYPEGTDKVRYRLQRNRIQNEHKPYLATRPKGLETFSDDRTALKFGFYSQLPEADIVHLHWTSGFLDFTSLFKKIRKPLVWTLHDMYPFTGGCHYNVNCDKYLTHCGKCFQLGSEKEKDLSFQIWERKKKALENFGHSITVLADSHWLAGEARKSSLFSELPIGTVHYGIETDDFIPLDKISCRKALSIPTDRRVVVFGAPGLDNPRKGYRYLREALMILRKKYPDIFLLSFGAGITENKDFPGINFGHIPDNRLLAMLYNCGDVFVIPSIQEAFGQTALEALSCGIPVAGFETGGIPDMIRNGKNGYLAEPANAEALADAIEKILGLEKDQYLKFSDNARQMVLEGFTLKHQADMYLKIYRQVIS